MESVLYQFLKAFLFMQLFQRISAVESFFDLPPIIGNNILLLFVYALFGVGFPLVFMWGFREGKTIIEKYF